MGFKTLRTCEFLIYNPLKTYHMLHSAHIFIGKEFEPLVEAIGSNLAKQNPTATQYINLYNLIGEKKINRLDIQLPDDVLLQPSIQWSAVESDKGEDYPSFWSTKIYDVILNVANAAQGQLYVFIHLPLYNTTGLNAAKDLCKAINASMRPVSVDFVGYCDDMVPFIEPNAKNKPEPSAKIVPAIKAMYSDLNYTPNSNHFVVIQNRTQKGIALLSKDDGVKPFQDMVTQLSLLFVSHYDNIFDSRVAARDVVGIGFSSLYFDAYLFADYLLHKTMMCVIDNQSVNNNDVDVNAANKQANEILKNKANILSKFFEQWKGRERETEENPEAYDVIKAQAQEIFDRTVKYFTENKDMTAKAAVLASLLSQTECELFSNSVYNPTNTCFDELYEEAIDFFIKEDDVEYYRIADAKPYNPIQELKQVNIKLMQAEVMVRSLKEQLEGLEEQIENTKNVKKCYIDDEGYFTFDDKKFRLLPEFNEEPLKDNYEDHPIAVSSIDLRSNFRPIQNQGHQGSCLSFTLTSIFEYMMKASGKKEYDLSEAFLYYNARDLDGDGNVNEDNGSRFHPSIKSLREYGLALEKVWPYNDDVYNQKPSPEAYEDAATRKLVKELNVRLSSDAIKSALADGYPVAGSFVLYPSFDNSGGYIPMPTAEEMEESKDPEKQHRHGHHAMTIVGFSDQMKMFLVRNSWGVDWGDKGYCYVPYEYIDNPNLFKFACIFTEITSLEFKKPDLKEIPALKVNSDDLRIKYYINQASLQVKEEEVSELKQQREKLIEYFQVQKNVYADANSRDEFIRENVTHLEEINTTLKDENKKMEQEQEDIFVSFKAKRRKEVINLVVFVLVTALVLWGYNYLLGKLEELGSIAKWAVETFSLNYLWLLPVWGIYMIFAYIRFRKYWNEWRNRRDELDLQINNNKKVIKANELRISLFRFKAFAAWLTLTSLENVQLKLLRTYTNIINLINNLRAWYTETKESCQEIDLSSTFPNISLVDKSTLDNYFDAELSLSKVCEMDLSVNLENYEITPEYLAEFKANFIKELKTRLMNSLNEIKFDIANHAVNKTFNNIAKEVTKEVINDLDNQAQMFVHVQSMERPMVVPDALLFTPNINKWRTQLDSLFKTINPSTDGSDDLCRMTLLRMATLSFDECVALRQPTPTSKKGK